MVIALINHYLFFNVFGYARKHLDCQGQNSYNNSELYWLRLKHGILQFRG